MATTLPKGPLHSDHCDNACRRAFCRTAPARCHMGGCAIISRHSALRKHAVRCRSLAAFDDCGALRDCRYLLHDRDTKFTRSFRAILVSGRVKPLALPARSPNLNAYAERWVRSVKEECLSKVILFGERSLRRALSELRRPFPCRAESPGEGQRPAVSSEHGSPPRGAGAVPRAIGRAPALLSS